MAKTPVNDGFLSREIDEIVNLQDFDQHWYKPEEFLGIPLFYLDATHKSGNLGDYVVMDVQVESSGEQIAIATGAGQPLAVVKALKASGTTNVRFTFAQEGRRTLIVKAPML